MDNGNEIPFWNCRIDTSGRLVLPQQVRSQQDIDNGSELVVTIEDGAIVLRRYADAMQRLQDAFCDGIPPDVSLSRELIEERKHEALRAERH